jgi:hypothetical protein
MRTTKFTKRGPALAAVTAASLALLLTSTALAAGAGATSVTQTFHDATQTIAAANPCTGDTGTVELTYNGVAHATLLANGTGHATFTATGTFTFTPDDPALATFTGHVTMWDGENVNLQNSAATATLTVHGTGSDGSRLTFHDVVHFSVSASGITISFDKLTCG